MDFMRSIKALRVAAALPAVFSLLPLPAHGQPAPSDTPTFRATSRLVFLDVTVLDRNGRPVVKGLTRNDFTITESKKRQTIFSFDPPESHVVNLAEENPAGQAPVTVFVLDLLNSRFEDFAYIRYQVRKYLAAQPARLNAAAELMVLGNQSLEMVQGYTTSKEDLLYGLDHVPAALPYKLTGSFFAERFEQSIDALQQIALQNKGIPGRKNIVWVGHGGPSLFTEYLPGSVVGELNQYVHDTTNMLVDARMSLFVIYPGLRVQGAAFTFSETSAGIDIGDDDPFSGDINFGVFVNETGGNLFYNRNDIASEIKRSQELGSEYYTLTYEPPTGLADGKFRRVRVTVRDPSLRVLTKAGYFAPNGGASASRRQQRLTRIAEAVRSTLPFPGLALSLEDVVRHPDTGRVEFTVVLQPENVVWQAADSGKSTLNLLLAAASLTQRRDVLASKMETMTVSEATQDAAQLARTPTRIPVRLRAPPKTESVRVVVESAQDGPVGSVELNGKALAAALQSPTPQPKLIPRPPPAKETAASPGR
jgi:VWFA-related protein